MITKKAKNGKSWKNKISGFILLFIIIIFIGFFSYVNWKINKRRSDLLEKISSLEQELQELENKNQELKQKQAEAGTGDYIEKVARDQLELKKPGEEVVVIQKEPASAESSGEAEENKTWWDKIKSIFIR